MDTADASDVKPIALCRRDCDPSGINRDTAYYWTIPVYKVGRLWKFRHDEIDS